MKLTNNITVKLITYLIAVSILPLLIFAFASYDVVRRTMFSLAGDYSTQLVNNQRDYLQMQLQQVEDMASRIASIEEISAVAIRSDAAPDGERNSYDELSTQAEIRQSLNLYSNLKGVVSIDFLTAKGHRFYVGDTLKVPPLREDMRLRIFHEAQDNPKTVAWLGVEDNLNSASPNRKVLTAVKVIRRYSEKTRTSEPVAMILIDYSIDFLANHFSTVDLGHDSYMLVSDPKGRLVYAPDRNQAGNPVPAEFKPLIAAPGDPIVRMEIQGSSKIISRACLPDGAWCLFGVIPEKTLLAPMQRMSQVVLGLMLLCFAVIAFASRLFRRDFVLPITAITRGFQDIQRQKQGSVHALPVPPNRDEITELVRWFNAFLETMQLRQQYENELETSRRKFASIFQFSPVPLALVQLENGLFVDVNDAWLTQFGFQRDEVIGKTSLELNLWESQEQRATMLEQIKRMQNAARLEIRQRHKDGRILLCQLSGHPISITGDLLFVFALVDVTRQREIEHEIREMNVQLETRVRLRTMKLEEANHELADAMESLQRTKGELVRSEKLAALGALVAGIAHELNTPIGNSVTVASTLQDQTREIRVAIEAGRIKRAAIDDYFDTVGRGTEMLMRNLESARELIGNFKQVAADQASNQRRRFELKETIEGVVVTLAPMYKKSNYSLRCDIQAGVFLDSFPGPLGQVITNFVTNALAHAFEGRASGSMILRARTIDLEHVEIAFSDDGIGIPKENQNRVFDPFFTTKLGRGGSGLGLNIVYNIVKDVLGGTITLESQVGVGTIFTVVVPLHAPELDVANEAGHI